jgi:hypothetical protein
MQRSCRHCVHTGTTPPRLTGPARKSTSAVHAAAAGHCLTGLQVGPCPSLALFNRPNPLTKHGGVQALHVGLGQV